MCKSSRFGKGDLCCITTCWMRKHVTTVDYRRLVVVHTQIDLQVQGSFFFLFFLPFTATCSMHTSYIVDKSCIARVSGFPRGGVRAGNSIQTSFAKAAAAMVVAGVAKVRVTGSDGAFASFCCCGEKICTKTEGEAGTASFSKLAETDRLRRSFLLCLAGVERGWGRARQENVAAL